ncbi:MAG: Gfo/Idh/MocA family oxidoreductase [Patescibacteria group bacterium]
MKTYRGVVIGCGKVGATFEMDTGLVRPASHAAALVAHPQTELVALVDPMPEALERAGGYYKVPTYTDAETCFTAMKPDIVIIATPPPTHEAMLALAFAHNIPAVICEKPVADTRVEAERMIDATAKASTLVIVNHQRRFFPLFIDAKERIAKGELGRVQQITAYYTNGLTNNGTHTLDAIAYLIADHATWVVGVRNEKNTTAPFSTNIDGLVGYAGGAVAAIQSLDNDSYGVHDFRIYGTEGVLTIGQYGYAFSRTPVAEGITFAGVKEPDWEHSVNELDKRSMLLGTLAHTVECLERGTPPRSTLSDGYQTMQVLEALTESADNGGQRITIS